jgi:hypothetical protein
LKCLDLFVQTGRKLFRRSQEEASGFSIATSKIGHHKLAGAELTKMYWEGFEKDRFESRKVFRKKHKLPGLVVPQVI